MITTYITHQSANQGMEKFHYQNALVLYELSDQLTWIMEGFQKRLEKVAPKQRIPLAYEFKEVISEAGKGKKITAPLKLYNCNKGYGFEICYLGKNANVANGFFTSIDELVDNVRDSMSRSLFSPLGIEETSFLYTVTEPYHFSEQEKKKAREEQGYSGMDSSQQSHIDTLLDAFVEYGLGPEEAQEFEKAYLKFFN